MTHTYSTHTCRIPTDEAITAMSDLSSGAYKLLIYYYSKSTGWEFQDEEIAKSLCVAVDTLRKLHKELTDKKYFLIIKGKVDLYFIGRKAVLEWTDFDLK